jgi:hypothetical protein
MVHVAAKGMMHTAARGMACVAMKGMAHAAMRGMVCVAVKSMAHAATRGMACVATKSMACAAMRGMEHVATKGMVYAATRGIVCTVARGTMQCMHVASTCLSSPCIIAIMAIGCGHSHKAVHVGGIDMSCPCHALLQLVVGHGGPSREGWPSAWRR